MKVSIRTRVSLVLIGFAGVILMLAFAAALYGMAWGIQRGYLKARDYQPACDRAWTAMVSQCVHPDGFLGWMQGTGKDPSAGQPLSYDRVPDFEDYGTGCFLLGATEYYKLLKRK